MSTLATDTELNTHLQRTVDPDVAALALAGASGLVRDFCGWNLTRETVTFHVDTDYTQFFLNLPTLHLVDVLEIRVEGVAVDMDQPIPPRWLRRGQLCWNWPMHRKVEVDAVHGYDDTPDLVRLVTLTVAGRIVSNPDDVKSASVGSVSRTFDTSLSALELRLLDPYRL